MRPSWLSTTARIRDSNVACRSADSVSSVALTSYARLASSSPSSGSSWNWPRALATSCRENANCCPASARRACTNATEVSTVSATTAAASPLTASRTLRRAAARSARARWRLASRNSCSNSLRRSDFSPSHSASRTPRYSIPSSRSRFSHSSAVSVSLRCAASCSRSSVSQSRNRGHDLISASCATSTVSSPNVTNRAAASRVSTVGDRRLVRAAGELRPRHPSSRVLRALPQRDEPQEHVLRQRPLVLVEVGVHRLRRLRDRAVHTADGAVGGERHRVAAPAFPRLEQRVRHQRQRAGLAVRVRDDGLDQCRLHLHPGQQRRFADDTPQVVRRHRPHQHLAVPQRRDQLRVLGTPGEEVGPHTEHDLDPVVLPPRGRDQAGDERLPFLRVAAQREDLLELVDHDQDPRTVPAGGQQLAPQRAGVLAQAVAHRRRGDAERTGQPRRELLDRMWPRRQHDRPPVRTVRTHRRHQPGPQQRRLPAPRGPEHRDERVACQPRA